MPIDSQRECSAMVAHDLTQRHEISASSNVHRRKRVAEDMEACPRTAGLFACGPQHVPAQTVRVQVCARLTWEDEIQPWMRTIEGKLLVLVLRILSPSKGLHKAQR